MSRAVFSCVFLALCLTGVAHAAGTAVFQGGETLSLSGLPVSDAVAAHLSLVNRARVPNRCTLALTAENTAENGAEDGAPLAPVMTLTLRPLESLPFRDVFEDLAGAYGELKARAAISCDERFSASALVVHRASGHLERVTPEPVYASDPALGLAFAADTEVPECPTGATCFDAAGLVHVPAPPPERPVGRVAFPAPGGNAQRLRMSLDVTVGAWYPQQPSGKHLIYWFVIDRNLYMPGLLYFRGPGKNEAFARHGINLTHPQKIKVIRKFTALPGHTYHVVNDYDMARRAYSITITDNESGAVKARLESRPNVESFNIKSGAKFLVDMGFYPGLVPTEVPSYDWKYSNVHVEAYMK